MMTDPKAVCIVIPVYNRANTVLIALDCLLRQTQSITQLVVVDDGSTDGTSDSVRRWLEQEQPPFAHQLVVQSNQGAAAARNRGLNEVGDAEFIAFLDSDDTYREDFVQRCVAALTERPMAVAATCDQQFLDRRSGQRRLRELSGIAVDATRWLIHHDGGLNSATMIRSSALRDVGGFDTTLPVAEDLKFYLQLSRLGPWLHVPSEASVIGRGAAEDAECGPLSDLGPQARLFSLRVLEEFVASEPTLDRSQYQDALARICYQAGRDLLRAGDVARARECLSRCHYWNRWHWKAWWKRLVA